MAQTSDPTGALTTRQWRTTSVAGGPLVSEQVTANIYGQWIDHSTAAGTVRRYTYDKASRLTAVTNLGANAACNARSYSYNTNSDRLGEAATTPVPAGATSPTNPTGCTTPAAPPNSHTFDSADRLTDPGYTYDTFGRTTRLPLGGATGTSLSGQVMRVGYNVNDLVATQQVYANATDADANSGAGANPTASQTYTLDATGGRQQTFTNTGADPTTGAPVTTTKTNRYATASDSPQWIDEGTTGPAANTMTRNITGPTGLIATTSNPAGGGAGTLDWQLSSLHGDIAVVLPDNITQALRAVPLADEFGVPNPTDTTTHGANNRYGWLGGAQRSTEAPGGITLMGVRLYNPTTGNFLSTDPVAGGNPNTYTYPNDPVNDSDLTGKCNDHTTSCIMRILTTPEAYPTGFLKWLKKRGSSARTANTKAGYRAMLVNGDHCTFVASTGSNFNFTNACDTHDLGYDLMRFMGTQMSGRAIVGARKSVDQLFKNDMYADCNARSGWSRAGCNIIATKNYVGVDFVSGLVHYGVPG